ncbi:asparagine synthase (glutamine-hydrolyzing) [Helicobacter sp.]|uniref:asparagine synthase (glutamine-hydrolyzing) n=1 Tax=Helicobacter sp. TaxID=218 RepID=UPI0025C09DD7|nr:asparagine synthase (glutamine-hydrolyzing) [Helicobacter sp.]MCI5968906.1 asparagine synthase (glutamine-hydrolyzing) [Helicobacter sp.]MDY2584356.1 asparagine synthase (glutamine-hydrolyzing) [Helicobacter sp.]
MCRIVGGWEFDDGASSFGGLFESIESMRDSMVSGGPDDCGVYYACKARVALAHRRLSIIDLSSFSRQPFVSRDGRYVLVFNGEIYNYKEIAKELQKDGIQIDLRSDTQVLLRAFMRYGVECVKRFDGMFAFVVWDNLEQKLYLCRDRMGVKPLYYYLDSNVFLFASELKGILSYPKLKKSINKESLSYYFAHGYIPAPFSILESCYKLEAGHYAVLDSKKNFTKTCYYDIKESFKQKQELDCEKLESLLQTSIKRRMVSDVPVGVCLSGGVDSSLVCAVLKDLGYGFTTFSIGFKEAKFDESHFAREVAQTLGVENRCFICSIDEAKELILGLPFVYDEPFADSSAIPTLLLARKIAQTHKVALSADGGDELMLGYDRYFWAESRWKEYTKFRALKVFNALFALPPELVVSVANKVGITLGIDKFLRIKNQLKARDFLEHYLVEISHFRAEDFMRNGLSVISSLRQEFGDVFDVMSCFDCQTYLPYDILVKTDRASMRVGLEMREPLLGVGLVDYAVGLGSAIKRDGTGGKVLFKRYLEKFLPKSLIYRPKMGFGVPLESWIKGELCYLLEDVLEYSKGYLDRNYVRNLLRDFDRGVRVDFAKIWYIYTFCAWRKAWKI